MLDLPISHPFCLAPQRQPASTRTMTGGCMCRHLLSLLAGGFFPVARYSAAARNNKHQVRRCFPLSLALELSDRPALSLPEVIGRFWQTHWRRPETASLDSVGRFVWDNPQAGR